MWIEVSRSAGPGTLVSHFVRRVSPLFEFPEGCIDENDAVTSLSEAEALDFIAIHGSERAI